MFLCRLWATIRVRPCTPLMGNEEHARQLAPRAFDDQPFVMEFLQAVPISLTTTKQEEIYLLRGEGELVAGAARTGLKADRCRPGVLAYRQNTTSVLQ